MKMNENNENKSLVDHNVLTCFSGMIFSVHFNTRRKEDNETNSVVFVVLLKQQISLVIVSHIEHT